MVGTKGQVVIPKDLRDPLSIQPGDEVDFTLVDGAVRIEPVRPHVARLGALAGRNLVVQLEADRRAQPR